MITEVAGPSREVKKPGVPGQVRRAVNTRLLPALAAGVPRLLAGVETLAFVDIDDTIREVHGYAKQGAAYGYSGVKGLNAQLAVLSSPTCAPVIAAARLRKGNAVSGHGANRLIGDAWPRPALPGSPVR